MKNHSNLSPINYVPEKHRVRPFNKAIVTAAFYVSICVLYIRYSGSLAAHFAKDVHQLQQIEFLKGVLFVIITGFVYFMISFYHWKRIQTDEELIHLQQHSLLTSEKRAIVGMCAASLAHDLNNLLVIFEGLLSLLKKQEFVSEKIMVLCGDLEKGVDKLRWMSKRLSQTARSSLSVEVVPTDIGSTVKEILTLVQMHPDIRKCEVRFLDSRAISADINRSLLEMLIFNLVLNAAQATEKKGKVEVRIQTVDQDILLQVHDNGPGISPETAPYLFDACFTTKPDGSGLGLLAVKAFIDVHCGSVDIRQSSLGGALFEIRFPKIHEPTNTRDVKTPVN